MKLIPFHRFEFHSPLTRDAALEAMSKRVEPVKWLRWRWPSSDNDERFEGEMQADGFRVSRIIGYRNSFLPQVRGEVSAEARGSRVRITMRLHPLAIGFIAVWCAVALPAFVAVAHIGVVGFVIPLFMLLFIWALTMGAFWFEAHKQERVLRAIFQASGS